MSTPLVKDKFHGAPPSILYGGQFLERFGMSDEAAQVTEIANVTIADVLTADTYSRYREVFQFDRFLKNWRRNTLTSSNAMEIISDDNLNDIVALGKNVAPLILKEIHSSPSLLFVALERIFNENPIKKEHIGNMAAMAGDWLEWGARKGLAKF